MMSEAPERIWLIRFVKDEYGARLGRGDVSDLDHSPNPDYPEYIRADLVEAAVKRALEGAANCLLMFSEPGVALDYSLKDEIKAIRSLASDPAQFVEGEKT